MRRQIWFKRWAPSSGSYVNLVALNDDIRLEKFMQLGGEREASSDGAQLKVWMINGETTRWQSARLGLEHVSCLKEKVEKVLLREINHELPT